MKTKINFKLIIIIGILIIALSLFFYGVTIKNDTVALRNEFNGQIDNRTATMNNMFKIINGKQQVSVRNDSSFQNVVSVIMEGRKDNDKVFFKWIQEQNPNQNFNNVTELYKDLSRSIEGKRDEFLQVERNLRNIKIQHDNMLDMFPSNFILSFIGEKRLEYNPLVSSQINSIIKNGIDDNEKIF